MSLFYCLCFHSVECKICTKSFENLLRIFRVIMLLICQRFVVIINSILCKDLTKRRRRDLNPRAAINDLLPFQGSPFNRLGTSPYKRLNRRHQLSMMLAEREGFEPSRPFGQTVFKTASLWPLRYLSITYLILFRCRRLCQRLDYLTKRISYCQHLF